MKTVHRLFYIFVLLTGQLLVAQVTQTGPAQFAVTSVRPSNPDAGLSGLWVESDGKVNCGMCTVAMLVMYAYDLPASQVTGGPNWAESGRYDVIGIPEPPTDKGSPQRVDLSQIERDELKALLASRFALRVHLDHKVEQIYELERNSKPLKMKLVDNSTDPPWFGGPAGGAVSGDGIAGTNISMSLLAERLRRYFDRPVVDKTQLPGRYNFVYRYAEGEEAQTMEDVVQCILTSLQNLGLSIKSSHGSVEVIRIDSVQRPTTN